ncbi:MAG: putative DNA binding domain-containing protein [Candidatus Metalachnospira sp.]|nr:putative DNA binding domain-containing protein [Candidatus Metalachnospira sp.]
MTIQKLEELLNAGEGEKLDYKEQFLLDTETKKKEFVKDITAIANTKGGRGYLIFGVEDKTRSVVGIEGKRPSEESIFQIISTRCDPPVPVRYEEILYKGKLIIIITVFKSTQKPHQILQTGTFYVRRGSTTDIARRQELAGMFQDSGLVSYETTPVRHSNLDDLDNDMLQKYILLRFSPSEKTELLILESMGIIAYNNDTKEYIPTAGGLLLFGKNPQRYLTSTGIRLELNGKVTLFEGNIPTMLDSIKKFVSKNSSLKNYPVNAIYEALYNAVVHRDYWDTTRETVLIIKRSSIEITNPGAIWNNDGSINMENDINPPRRNNWLYQRLLLTDKDDRFLNNPIGIRTLNNSFEKYGLKVKYINLIRKNLFKVILPGIDDIKNK